jgi:hypothetical protein
VVEEFEVVVADTIGYPRTMMIIFQNAGFTLFTMVRPLRFPRVASFTVLFMCDSLLLWNLANFSIRCFEIAPIEHEFQFENKKADNPSLSIWEIGSG